MPRTCTECRPLMFSGGFFGGTRLAERGRRPLVRNWGAQKLKRRRRNGENERWTLACKAKCETKGFLGEVQFKANMGNQFGIKHSTLATKVFHKFFFIFWAGWRRKRMRRRKLRDGFDHCSWFPLRTKRNAPIYSNTPFIHTYSLICMYSAY